ncbi:H/ACA ribonucleoprotein complex subunit GAR1 [Haloarcula argentinensis]|uniref:Gar1/Naf1 family protein n=1 Tax=Haloarcula argentinensis TaxID=43776 RepID=A0ABU2EXC6_HALAR|nr:Gar1/Naf1 family protein [Haloarcula argentinensis]EMA23758.1 H/ACA RNA-protein complex component Gar1 [Haloarcula argentinensis DSM 12282]MDS0252638.1 Gar1/Naf1 family protein [Haloarcula argentinensis]
MKRIGTVSRVAQGLAVVRAPDDEYAAVGTDVVDEELQTVGSVVDVFGPVERPYLAVSPNDSVHLPVLVGTVLYAR